MPGYRTQQQRIVIAGVGDLVIRSLLDRQQFFDPIGAAARRGISSATWPLFGVLWPSGVQLAERLAARPVYTGERILEIGCGLALASLVGHRRGADVTASDCHPLAADFLAENLRLNGLAPMKYRYGLWAEPTAPEPTVPAPTALRAADDAQEPRPVRGRYDLLIGSDVLYERDAGGTLAGFIARHAAPDAEVWIVDPDRGNRAAFNRRMAGHGFSEREERLDRPASATSAAYKGRLLMFRHGDATIVPAAPE